MDGRWFKTFVKIVDWEWFTDSHMVHLLIYFLAKASPTDRKWQGIDIKRGQLVTSRAKIAADTGISEQTIRTCLRRLEETGEIKIEPTKRFSLVTVCKYDDYQSRNISSQPADQPTANQPSTNHQPTLIEYKNNRIKEDVVDVARAREGIEQYEDEIKSSQTMMENLCMTQHVTPRQYRGLCEDFMLEQQAKEVIYQNSSDFRRHAWDWMRKHIECNELDDNGHVKQAKKGQRNGNNDRRDPKTIAIEEADRRDLISMGIDPDSKKYDNRDYSHFEF